MENITPKANALSVTKLNKYIKKLLEDDFVLKDIFVTGEISNLKKHSSGHYYFTLKDEKCQINAVMFKSYTSSLNFDIENGMSVTCYGYVSMYEVSGQFQLYVEFVALNGIGSLSVEYEKLKEKLMKKGYFDESHKKAIPMYPKTVAVLTADKGAGIQDIIKTIKRRNRLIKIIVVKTIVQGVHSKKSIVENIENVNKYNDVDVILLGRGGGSIEDLWSFNEEEVCDAIYNSKIPIISCVGHETDFTLSDFVADLRASTPTAGAEIVSTPLEDLQQKVYNYTQTITYLTERNFISKKNALNNLVDKNVLKRPELLVLNEQNRLLNLTKELNFKMEIKLNISKNRFKNQSVKLELNSPIKILNSGYTLTYKDEKLVKNSSCLKKDDLIKIKFSDGEISASVR